MCSSLAHQRRVSIALINLEGDVPEKAVRSATDASPAVDSAENEKERSFRRRIDCAPNATPEHGRAGSTGQRRGRGVRHIGDDAVNVRRQRPTR